jgi:hypothetical protein
MRKKYFHSDLFLLAENSVCCFDFFVCDFSKIEEAEVVTEVMTEVTGGDGGDGAGHSTEGGGPLNKSLNSQSLVEEQEEEGIQRQQQGSYDEIA